MADVTTRVNELLEEKFTETDLYTVDVKLLPGNKLQVFIDSDSGITIEKCAEVSRYLEKHIEEEKLLPENYLIEVSSPGVGQPLKLERQYKNNIGRKLEVTLTSGVKETANLVGVNANEIILEKEVKDSEKKGKKTEIKQFTIPIDKIKQAKVKVTF